MDTIHWHGIAQERFKRYEKWINTDGQLCGSYAAAVFLAYLQDYEPPFHLPRFVRQMDSADGENLVHYLRLFIQPLGLATIPLQVSWGISRFCRYVDQPYWARLTPIGGWERTVKRIDQGLPLIVGLNKKLGSTYGNHWVVAYAYGEDQTGKRWVKVHDNWGNYRAVVPAKWLMSTVSFKEIGEIKQTNEN
ncbi:MAG: hypothetical protein ACTH87_00645 [Enterococcus italicus]|uniref:hypothetical protein n=1 Tax=Enterococcus italicus TaxID=246144 RepID=UPI000EC31D91|nr:hypothetical protein [Enterococcus sp.]